MNGKAKTLVYPNALLMGLSGNLSGGYFASFDMGDGYLEVALEWADYLRLRELVELDQDRFDLEIEVGPLPVSISRS